MGNINKDSNITREDNKDVQDIFFYRFIINNLPTAVLTVNSDLKITDFNPWGTSLDKELMELSDSYELKTWESRINLVLENETELPVIMADTGHLCRVFSNL